MGGVGEEGRGRWKTEAAESSDGLGFLRVGQLFPTVPRGCVFVAVLLVLALDGSHAPARLVMGRVLSELLWVSEVPPTPWHWPSSGTVICIAVAEGNW